MIGDPRWSSEEQSIQYARGIVALHRGELSLAQRILESVALSLPNDSPVQRSYARSLIAGDRSAESTDLLESSSAKKPSALTSLLLAKALVKVGRWDDATRAAMSARAQASKTHTHPRVRAEALAIDAQSRVLAGRRADRETALRHIRQALAIEPDLPDGLLAKGLLEESGRRPSKAVPTYRRLVQVQPQSAQGYFRLGRLLSRKARTRSAGRRALATALRLDPDGIWGTRASRVLGR